MEIIFFFISLFFWLTFKFWINKIVAIEVAKNKDVSSIIKQSINISFYLFLIILIIGIILSYFEKLFTFLL